MDRNTHIGNVKKGKDVVILNIIAYTFSGLIALICLIPFVMILAASFSSETAITANGFSLVPQDFSLDAYKTVFKEPMVVFRAYATTIMLTVVGTTVGLVVQTMTAYVLSRKDFEWRNGFSFFFYFTTLFSGGLVPTYILYTRTLNLQDNYFALLLPLIFSVYNLLIMKSYISAIPDSLVDAARIDGCGEIRTLFQVIMPLIKPALATVGLFIALAYWNDWYNCMLFINDSSKWNLQYTLQNILNSSEALNRMASQTGMKVASLPAESMKMAMTVVAIGPIILLYPFLQKYFVKGMTVGSVKG